MPKIIKNGISYGIGDKSVTNVEYEDKCAGTSVIGSLKITSSDNTTKSLDILTPSGPTAYDELGQGLKIGTWATTGKKLLYVDVDNESIYAYKDDQGYSREPLHVKLKNTYYDAGVEVSGQRVEPGGISCDQSFGLYIRKDNSLGYDEKGNLRVAIDGDTVQYNDEGKLRTFTLADGNGTRVRKDAASVKYVDIIPADKSITVDPTNGIYVTLDNKTLVIDPDKEVVKGNYRIADGDNLTIIDNVITHKVLMSAGSAGSATSIPTLSWDTKGHIKSISRNTVYPPTTVGEKYQYWMSSGIGQGDWKFLLDSAVAGSKEGVSSGGLYTELAKRDENIERHKPNIVGLSPIVTTHHVDDEGLTTQDTEISLSINEDFVITDNKLSLAKHIYMGTTAPASGTGKNGDVYFVLGQTYPMWDYME